MTNYAPHPGAASAGRILWIDIVKALAAWMVVTSHLLRQGALTDLLAAISVSIFYMLAGVTMHPHADLRQFLQRLLRRIVVPYLAVGLISIAVYRILGSYAAGRLGANVSSTSLPEDLLHLVYGSSVAGRMKWNESLWFLPCYCLMILMAELIEQVGRRHDLLRLALYIAGGCVGYRLIAAGIVGLPWHLETALLVLPLCGFGRFLGPGLAGRYRPSVLIVLMGLGWLSIGLRMFESVEVLAGGSLSLRAPHLAGAEMTYWFLITTSIGIIYLTWCLVYVIPILAWSADVGARSLDIVLWNKFPVLVFQVVVPVFLPGFEEMFIGGEDLASLAYAAALAILCMAACLAWTACYTAAWRRLRRGTGAQ